MSKPDLLLVAELSKSERAALGQDFAVHDLWQHDDREAFLRDVGSRIRAVATRGDIGIDAEMIHALPHLEIVSVFGVGFDAVDLDAARARGIRVTNTPEVLTDDVADMAMALLLATSRRIVEGHQHVVSGAWQATPMRLTSSLRGKTLGIFGLGRVGRAVARRAAAFGMKIAYASRQPRNDCGYLRCTDLTTLALFTDVLVLCAEANAQTIGAVDAAVLEALGPQGILINIARGTLVDEEALIAALADGTIAGAGLDVFLGEPEIDRRFMTLRNVVLQPHNGSGTTETRREIGRLMRDNLAAHFAGRPLPTPVI